MGSIQYNGGKDYTLQAEAERIFNEVVHDPRLNVPSEAKELASSVKFTGEETQPFFPVPYKCAETQGALLGLIGLLAASISKTRYGVEQDVEIDVGQAMLNGLGCSLIRCEANEDGWLAGNKQMISGVQRWDHGQTRELYRQLATNIYKTKDGRWFSLHGSMDPTPVLTMLGMAQHNEKDLSWPQILDVYSNIVGSLDSETLDNWSNNVYRVPGTICYEEDEFKSTAHGKAIKDEPWYSVMKGAYYEQPPVPWGPSPTPSDARPLSGIKVLDLSRAIAAPTIGRVCAALGATVIRVSSATNNELPITLVDGCIGKISVDINLKTFEGRKKLMELIEEVDIFIDGYRPSVLEHLGFGRDAVFGLVAKRDRGIIYCQENCYGWKGPWQTRAGWAQIADAVSGVGLGIGRFHGYDESQTFGPNADYMTGHAGAAGTLHALMLRNKYGGSYTVQCSLTISNLHLLSYGAYNEEQIAKLQKRNPDIVGHLRHYDELISHSVKRHIIHGYIADRPLERAIKKDYYQELDGSPWGWSDPIQVATLGIRLGKTRTDFPIGAAPPGYHRPQWTVEKNPGFEQLPVYTRGA